MNPDAPVTRTLALCRSATAAPYRAEVSNPGSAIGQTLPAAMAM